MHRNILAVVCALPLACGVQTQPQQQEEVYNLEVFLVGDWQGPLLAGEPGFALAQSRLVSADFTNQAFKFSSTDGTNAAGTFQQTRKNGAPLSQLSLAVSTSTIPELLTGAELSGHFLVSASQSISLTFPGLHFQMLRKSESTGDASPAPIQPARGQYKCSDAWSANILADGTFFLAQGTGVIIYGRVIPESSAKGSLVIHQATDEATVGRRLAYSLSNNDLLVEMPDGQCRCSL